MNQTSKICQTLNAFLEDVFKVKHSIVYLWSDEDGAFAPMPVSQMSNRFLCMTHLCFG